MPMRKENMKPVLILFEQQFLIKQRFVYVQHTPYLLDMTIYLKMKIWSQRILREIWEHRFIAYEKKHFIGTLTNGKLTGISVVKC